MHFYDVIGFAGAAAIIAAYFANQQRWLRSEDWRYPFANLVGAALILVSPPRNHFPLAEQAERHLLLAGGIGITPVMAMIAELKRRRADFRLYYCTRAPEKTAFREELDLLAAMGRVVFHYDDGDPAKALDIAAVLREPQP